MSFPENREQGESNTYADDGTATHTWAAAWLKGGAIDAFMLINGKGYTLDEDRAERIQDYVDDVRRRATGGHLFVEAQVDLSEYLGANQGGTADAAIVLPAERLGVVEDLKDGSGEQVYASHIVKAATDTTPEIREPNPQLALYALGMLPTFELFGPVDNVLLVIYQPKLNHIDEFKISVGRLKAFGAKAAMAVARAETSPPELNPGTKQCRWCRAKTRCPALAKFVADEVRSDFETIQSETPALPISHKELATAYESVPLIEQWCAAIKAELQRLVSDGQQVIGCDGKPYKFVEGREGARAWDKAQLEAAEAALVGQLGPKAYSTPKLLTAPAAGKLLDKKATKAMWADVFEPMITRPRGQPILTLGSDERPAFSGAAKAEDFELDPGDRLGAFRND